MMQYLSLMVLVAAPWALQEGTPLDRWIADLGDEKAAVREAAHQSLLAEGPRAIPRLRLALASTDAEVRERATVVLDELVRDQKLASFIPTAPAVTLTLKDVAFDAALKDVAAITGIQFETVSTIAGKTVSATFARAPLLQVLDGLGAAADLQWAFVNEKTVAWRTGASVAHPSCYSGGFRASLSRIDVYKSWNHQESKGLLWVYLETRTEPGINPLGLPRFEVSEIRDDADHELTSDSVIHECVPKGYAQDSSARGSGYVYESPPFTVSQLQHLTRTLSKISGRAIYLFPLDRATVEITDLSEESSATQGDLLFQVNDILTNSMRLTVIGSGDVQYLQYQMEVNSLVLIDADGREYAAGTHFSVRAEQVFLDALKYIIEFNENVCFQPVAVRFTVNTRFYEKSVPFEFKNVQLP